MISMMLLLKCTMRHISETECKMKNEGETYSV